jgi:hypothetical protein
MNSAPIRRALFLGNSITLHAPAPDIGWTGNWGMAASSRENDYVHLLLERFAESNGGNVPEAKVANIADFERGYATFDIEGIYRAFADFAADVVILAIGENVPPMATEQDLARFRDAVAALLEFVKGTGAPTICVRSSFWPDSVKDPLMRQVCADSGGIFVYIGQLAAEEKYYARSEREYAHDGVAAHPGDAGMLAIADAIWEGMKGSLPGA